MKRPLALVASLVLAASLTACGKPAQDCKPKALAAVQVASVQAGPAPRPIPRPVPRPAPIPKPKPKPAKPKPAAPKPDTPRTDNRSNSFPYWLPFIGGANGNNCPK